MTLKYFMITDYAEVCGNPEYFGYDFTYEVDWKMALPVACKEISKQYKITEKQAYDLITDLDIIDVVLEYYYDDIKDYFETEAFDFERGDV